MAMNGTSTTQSDWAKLYLARQQAAAVSSVAESTVVTTTSSATSGVLVGGGTNTMQLNSDRRAGKPTRRRSRASRKAPTTLLNTDTSNFRAMVQQFTGFPSGQPMVYQPAAHGSLNQFNPQQVVSPFGVQQQPPQVLFHQQQYHQQQQQQQERLMFSLGNNSTSENPFVSGFGSNSNNNSSNHRANMEFSGGFVMQGMPTQQVMSRPSSTTDAMASNGFML